MQPITVITITYNAEAFLRQTLQSVACQTFRDFEHLIWDGGSTDHTLEIIAQFPHVCLHKGKDSGIADAMNQAAARARGRFLLFLHADDLLASAKTLEYLNSAIQQYPRAVWFYGRAHMIDEAGNLLRTTPIEHYSYHRLCKYNFITHPSTLVSKDLFNQLKGFDVQCPYCMDYDFWLKAGRQATPVYLPAVLSCFREHQRSTSISHPNEVADEAYQIRNRYITSIFQRWRSYRTWKKRRRVLQ